MLWYLVLGIVAGRVWGVEEVGPHDDWICTTKQGSVRGYKHPDGDFYVFYGVPYATAPSGPQRFQAPLPPPLWHTTYEAVDRGIVCPQINFLGLIENKVEQENCLVANIYVPKTKDKAFPVLVSVHGGGYVLGFGDLVTPKHLTMNNKAIIVNFNYRLGAHGFLCLGTTDVPGNAGMKDQVALLRWVRDNIASFGGNPNDVTITGCSAGSSSVDLLMLSKMANSLFNKVIPESGSNIAPFSVQLDPLENAKNYAKRLNFTNVDDIYALEDFYKTASYELLNSINVLHDQKTPFSPCVERDMGAERFLEDNPHNILRHGSYNKRPMLYGFAKYEGLVRIPVFDVWKEEMNTKFSNFLPDDLKFNTDKEKDEVAKEIKKFYFGDKPIAEDNILEYINFFTDAYFAYSTLKSVKLQVEAGNSEIYLYEYVYVDDDTPIIPYTNIRGANHCAQTMVINDGLNLTQQNEMIISNDLKEFKQTLREMWLNFVTTGKPVPQGSPLPAWPPTGVDGSPYMVLDKVPQLKNAPLLEKRVRFWDEIYSKHYRSPVPPSEPPAIHTEL